MKGCADSLFLAPLLLFFWIATILVASCTADAHAFLYEQAISFQLDQSPNFNDLLITHEIHLHEKFFIIQKVGHISAFGLLYFFLLATIKKFGYAFILCSIFAFFTEILQLFFHRNGRFFDVGFDLIGILIVFFICKILVTTSNSKKVYGLSG